MREATEEVEDGLNQMPRPENKGRGFGYPAGRLCQPAFVYVTHVVRTTQKPSAAKAEGAMNTVARRRPDAPRRRREFGAFPAGSHKTYSAKFGADRRGA